VIPHAKAFQYTGHIQLLGCRDHRLEGDALECPLYGIKIRQVWKDEKESDKLLDDYEGPVFVSRLPRQCFVHEATREACVYGGRDDDSDNGSEVGEKELVPSVVAGGGSWSGDERTEGYHSGTSDGGSDGGSDDGRDVGRDLDLEPVLVEADMAFQFPLSLRGGGEQGGGGGQGGDDGPGNGDINSNGPVAEPELVVASQTPCGVCLEPMAGFNQQSASNQTQGPGSAEGQAGEVDR
jgi:hypothetical protein